MSTVAISTGRITAPRSEARAATRSVQVRSTASARPAADHARTEGVVTPAAPARMRLTRRGRIVLVGLGLALAAGAGSVAGQAVAEAPPVEEATTTVVVGPGDSLWTIAQGITAPGEDVRDVVSSLAELNELDGLGLQVGEELLLPAS